jgi:hypothetical protein
MNSRKVTVNLPEDQVLFLQKISSDESISFTDALRRSINSERFFVQQESAGNKILVDEGNQRIREVLRK